MTNLDKAARQALEALAGMFAIVDDSQAVAGYHLNGELEPWEGFPEVEEARAAITALREALEAAPQPPEEAESDLPSDSSTKLAETILSDCGCSSNYTPLLERVAKRIDRHIEALEAVPAESNHEAFKLGYAKGVDDAERRAKARGEQPSAVEQEPVAGVVIDGSLYVPALVKIGTEDAHIAKFGGSRLYTTPQPTRQPLTGEQIDDALVRVNYCALTPKGIQHAVARAIERAHGIGGEA